MRQTRSEGSLGKWDFLVKSRPRTTQTARAHGEKTCANNGSPTKRYFPGRTTGQKSLTDYIPAQLTRLRMLVLIPLLALPVLYHVLFTRLGSSFHEPLRDNPYFHTGDVIKHNNQVSANMARCRALDLLRDTASPPESLSMEAEEERIEQGCGTNQTTVVILASGWFAEAFKGDDYSPETIYAQSAISTLNAHGYSYVFSSTEKGDFNVSKTVELWEEFRENVRMIWADPEVVDECWNEESQSCLKTAENPEGIEAWRMMTFAYDEG
jgi:hypothetical protein